MNSTMKQSGIINVIMLASVFLLFSCNSSRKFKSTFPVTDSVFNSTLPANSAARDSAMKDLGILREHRIDYKTFSAKIKVNYADLYGAQPEGNITLRLYKDSAIWISVSGSVLNLELYRAFI